MVVTGDQKVGVVAAHRVGLRVDSKAQAEQIRSAAFERVVGNAGRVSPEAMTALDATLRLHLAL